MNVAEYIEALQKLPQDLEVMWAGLDYDGGFDGTYEPAGEPCVVEWTPPKFSKKDPVIQSRQYVCVGSG